MPKLKPLKARPAPRSSKRHGGSGRPGQRRPSTAKATSIPTRLLRMGRRRRR